MGSGCTAGCRRRGVESHVVDPASILERQRRRNAKTDRIDGGEIGAQLGSLAGR
jgi:hypothetical protein